MKNWIRDILMFLIKLLVVGVLVSAFVEADDTVILVLIYVIVMIWNNITERNKKNVEIDLLKERIDELESELEILKK